jgi:hypothetical protein
VGRDEGVLEFEVLLLGGPEGGMRVSLNVSYCYGVAGRGYGSLSVQYFARVSTGSKSLRTTVVDGYQCFGRDSALLKEVTGQFETLATTRKYMISTQKTTIYYTTVC